MKHADFVHLHNHSDYSLLDGASSIPRMVERAAQLAMPALALTDHGSLFGAVEFYQAARRAGVKPIVGMEAYVTRGNRRDRTRETAHHLVLLARDEAGFKNLMKLSSLAFLEGFYYKPRVDHEILAKYGAGLLALSACPKGEIATDLLADDEAGALATAGMYRDLFGPENYFLEIQNHGLEIEDQIRERVKRLSQRTGIPMVATNDCHYLRHEDAGPHDVLLCIQTGKTVDDVNRMRYNTDQVYFKSADEMKALFGDVPEALFNTVAIAERCNLQMSFGKPLLPEFPLPRGVESAEAHLKELAWAGLRERAGDISEALRERLEFELKVIHEMGFDSYMLIVRDFIHYAKSRGIAVGPGRGSVAGSLVAYALRITDVDPIKHSLYFERFLNPERVSMPDIDIDFDDIRRGEVIDYVKQKYGEDNVTQIITFGTMGAKGVVRDVGRALGLAFAEVDRIAKLVPDGVGMTLEKALELSPDLKALPQKGPQFARLLQSARTLEGLARHASTHAAGVLITPGPLLEYVPLYRQKDESVTTQWDMRSVEKVGLLKMDFLGLRTLSALQEAVRLVRQHHGVEIDLLAIPEDDAATFKLFQDAETVAIFQFESSGMRDYLRKLKPTVLSDLVAMNALYRPGPMENIPYFIDCKHGRQVVRYDHPLLEPLLKDTYGVFVYQEQVMAAANVLAGFSLAKGDEMRRAMGKKNLDEMAAKRAEFVEGCKHNKIAPAHAEKMFATLEKFAGYGFNKCVTGDTELTDARTGERITVGELFRHRRPLHVHALGNDWKLRPRRVTQVMANGPKPVFELSTAQGRRIRTTANHPFRTLDGWKRLDELRVGDDIAAPRRMVVPAMGRADRHEVITLAGLLSEGNTCHPTTLYFYGNDPAFIEDFRQAVAQFPNTVAAVHDRGDGRLEVRANMGADWRSRVVRQPSTAALAEGNLALESPPLVRRSGAFEWACGLGLLGRKATDKRIPKVVFEWHDRVIELFLGRLWTGDGYIAGASGGAPFYATSSEGMARDVQDLLLRLGIVSRVHVKSFRYRGGLRPGYTVHLLGAGSHLAFFRHLGPHIVGRREQMLMLERQLDRVGSGMTSRDVIPASIRGEVDQARRRLGLTWGDVEERTGASMKEFTGRGSPNKRGFRRDTLLAVARGLRSMPLHHLATSDVVWDEIVAIEPRGIEETYDLTVERDHNFVANGLIVHNSHSAAYALVAYQSAFMKARYPAEFMAATLTSEMSDSARIVTLIEECRRMKLEIVPPDVSHSEWKFTIEDRRVRIGLGAVRNVGQAPIESLVKARGEGGAFKDLFDLARRLEGRVLNRKVLESLVASGACDALGSERGALFASVEPVLAAAAALRRDKESGQHSLFGEADHGNVAVAPPPSIDVPAWAPRDRSSREKEVLGFYFSEHPLEPLRDELARIATHAIALVPDLDDGTEVRVAGLVGEVRTISTKTGRLMGAVTLEDLTGRVECTVFPETFEAARQLLQTDTIVVAAGRVEKRDERPARLLLSEIRPLDEARSVYRRSLHLELRVEEISEQQLAVIDEVLSAHPGESEVYLHIVRPDHSRVAMRSKRYRVAEDDRVAVRLREHYPAMRVRWGKGA